MFATQKNQSEVLSFLVEQLAITNDQKDRLLHEDYRTHPTQIANLLEELQKSEKLQLVDYEWQMLPKNVMRLSIVGSTDKREFGNV
jgi:hypothetical protein